MQGWLAALSACSLLSSVWSVLTGWIFQLLLLFLSGFSARMPQSGWSRAYWENKREKTKNKLLNFSEFRKSSEQGHFPVLSLLHPLPNNSGVYSPPKYSGIFQFFSCIYCVIYQAYCFNFIGSPQHVTLPVQQASVVQETSPHSFTTWSSNPHDSQRRTWPIFKSPQFIFASPQVADRKIRNLDSNCFWNNDSEHYSVKLEANWL